MAFHQHSVILTKEEGTKHIEDLAGHTFHVPSRISFYDMYEEIIEWQEAKVDVTPRLLPCHEVRLQSDGGAKQSVIVSDDQVLVSREDDFLFWSYYTPKEIKLNSFVPRTDIREGIERDFFPLINDKEEAVKCVRKSFLVIGITRLWQTHPTYRLYTEKRNNFILSSGISVMCNGVWNR